MALSSVSVISNALRLRSASVWPRARWLRHAVLICLRTSKLRQIDELNLCTEDIVENSRVICSINFQFPNGLISSWSIVMFRKLAVLFLTLVSGASVAQMMGGSIATTQYFPLVDGARYDYMYTSGPWSTSTAVMHAGQTWAGVSGLTAMHTTYTCVVGVNCAPDATDFFRMDPDGMRYFGGTGANAPGTQFSMMTYTSPEWLLKNPVTPGTMMGGPRRLPEYGDVDRRRHGYRQHDGRTKLHE